MTAQWILLALLPLVAGIALTQTRRLSAIIGMGLFSFLLAAVYLLMKAPDVAITEATIGAALVTAIYILAIRRTGRLRVVADEVPRLIAREGDHIEGLEFEILEGFANEQGLDLSIHFVPLRRVRWLIAHGEADVAAGGMIRSENVHAGTLETTPHLETGLFAFGSLETLSDVIREAPDYDGYFSELVTHGQHGRLAEVVGSLDLARVLALGRSGVALQGLDRIQGTHEYTFLIGAQRREIHHDFEAYVARLRSSGQLDDMIERHFR